MLLLYYFWFEWQHWNLLNLVIQSDRLCSDSHLFYISVTSILREYWLRERNKQLDNYVLRFRHRFLEKRFFKAYFCLNLIKLSPVLFHPPPSALLSFPLEKSIQEVTVSHICLSYYLCLWVARLYSVAN